MWVGGKFYCYFSLLVIQKLLLVTYPPYYSLKNPISVLCYNNKVKKFKIIFCFPNFNNKPFIGNIGKPDKLYSVIYLELLLLKVYL